LLQQSHLQDTHDRVDSLIIDSLESLRPMVGLSEDIQPTLSDGRESATPLQNTALVTQLSPPCTPNGERQAPLETTAINDAVAPDCTKPVLTPVAGTVPPVSEPDSVPIKADAQADQEEFPSQEAIEQGHDQGSVPPPPPHHLAPQPLPPPSVSGVDVVRPAPPEAGTAEHGKMSERGPPRRADSEAGTEERSKTSERELLSDRVSQFTMGSLVSGLTLTSESLEPPSLPTSPGMLNTYASIDKDGPCGMTSRSLATNELNDDDSFSLDESDLSFKPSEEEDAVDHEGSTMATFRVADLANPHDLVVKSKTSSIENVSGIAQVHLKQPLVSTIDETMQQVNVNGVKYTAAGYDGDSSISLCSSDWTLE